MRAQRGNPESQAGSPWLLCSLAMTGFVILVVTLFHPVSAYAACSNPTGEAGEMMYNFDHKVMQYCNGSDWQSMGTTAGGGDAGGNDPAPDAFTVTDVSDVAVSTLVTSNIVQFTNFDTYADVGATGGDAEHRVCSDSACSTVLRDWGGGTGRIYNDQYAQFRATSDSQYETALNYTISVGGVTDTWTITTGLAPCTDVGGFCWYLAADAADSCDDVCALGTRGGYNAATLTYAGSDGTNANCESVLTALGVSGTVNYLTTVNGIGCAAYVYSGGSIRYRFIGEATNSSATYSIYRRACACNG